MTQQPEHEDTPPGLKGAREADAIAALQTGDIAGLETLVRLHQARALRVAYAVTADRHLAEDVVADAFVAVHDRIDQFDLRHTFAPWFYRIVTNRALNAIRQNRRSRRTGRGESELPEGLDAAPGPEAVAIQKETRVVVLDTLMSLPYSQRIALFLKYYLEMDERAIAQTMNCPIGTVKWRLYAGRKGMARRLRQAGMEEPHRSTQEVT